MELDEMKQAWQELSSQLGALRTECEASWMDTRKVRAAKPLRLAWGMICFEAFSNALMLALLAAFMAQHDQWRFLIPALLLVPLCVALFASSVRQLVMMVRLDLGANVVMIQQQLERLYVMRLRTVQFELLFACLAWVPVAIVLMWGVFGVDLYEWGAAWLVACVAFGVLAIPVLWWLARRFGKAFNQSAFGRFLLEDVTGHGLAAARRRMAALGAFTADME